MGEMKTARDWAGDRRLAWDSDDESEVFYRAIQRDALEAAAKNIDKQRLPPGFRMTNREMDRDCYARIVRALIPDDPGPAKREDG